MYMYMYVLYIYMYIYVYIHVHVLKAGHPSVLVSLCLRVCIVVCGVLGLGFLSSLPLRLDVFSWIHSITQSTKYSVSVPAWHARSQ